MNKLYSKIAALSVSLAMAVGVGVAIGSKGAVREARAAEYTELVADFTLKTAAHGKYDEAETWDYNDDFKVFSGANNNGGWDYIKMGGKSTYLTTYNPVYIATKTATTHATSKVTVNIIANTNSNKTKMGATWKLLVYSNAELTTLVDTVDKGTLDITTAQLYTFEPTSGDAWAAGSYFKVEWTCTNTSTTNGIVWLNNISTYYVESAVLPDSITVSGESTVAVGATTTFTSEAKKSGSSTGVDQNVTWSSSNEKVAKVSNAGVVTGVSNGTASIRATSKDATSVYGEKSITVNNGKTDNTALAVMPDDCPAGYGDNYITVGGVYLHAKQIMLNAKNIQIQKNDGLLENVAAFGNEIKTIELSFAADKSQGTGYAVSVSADGETFTPLAKDADTNEVYTVSAGNYYFRISAPTAGTLYLTEVLVGFGNSNEAKLVALAASLNALLDSECEGSGDTNPISESAWNGVKSAYTSGDADAKAALAGVGASGSYKGVNLFLERYDYIVGTYGYDNFLERAVASSSYSPVSSNMDSTGMIIIIAASATSLIGFGLLLILKKRKVQK